MKVRDNLEITFLCVAILWIVYFADIILPIDLRGFGIRPRRLDGLPGLIFSPFLHSGLSHLMSNSVALAPLLLISLTYSRKLTFKVVTFTALAGGLGTWAFGTGYTVHIGSSGIIFGLIGFLLAIGLFRGELLALAISMLVAAYYGWALFSFFIILPGISWSGHFFGFIAGVTAAWLTRRKSKVAR